MQDIVGDELRGGGQLPVLHASTVSAAAARFAVTGDFNHDGRDEIAVVPDAPGSDGNDLWVLGYAGGKWPSSGELPVTAVDARSTRDRAALVR